MFCYIAILLRGIKVIASLVPSHLGKTATINASAYKSTRSNLPGPLRTKHLGRVAQFEAKHYLMAAGIGRSQR